MGWNSRQVFKSPTAGTLGDFVDEAWSSVSDLTKQQLKGEQMFNDCRNHPKTDNGAATDNDLVKEIIATDRHVIIKSADTVGVASALAQIGGALLGNGQQPLCLSVMK